MHKVPIHVQKPIPLIHMNFDRGRATHYSLVPDPMFTTEMMPLFSRGQGELPCSKEVVLYVVRGLDCANVLVAILGQEFLTAGVAWGVRDRCSLYAFLIGQHEKSRGCSCPKHRPMPSSLPWLGTVGTPAFGRLPRRLQARLLSWSRRLAIAIICHSLATN